MRIHHHILGIVLAVLFIFSNPSAQASLLREEDEVALFNRIHQLRLKVQPQNEEEYGFLYLVNTAEVLRMHLKFYQMLLPSEGAGTTLHVYISPENAMTHPELVGKPSPFPQMWVRYVKGKFTEAGTSQIPYPSSFGLDEQAHPHLIYDYQHQRAYLP